MTSVTDNFNRANNTSLGTGWTDFADAGGVHVDNNQVWNGAAQHRGCFRTETFTDDQYAEIEITADTVSELSSGDFVGCIVRAQNSGDDFYTVFYFNLSGTPQLWLYKRVNDEFSPGAGGFLAQGDQTLITTLVAGDKIRLTVAGIVVRVLVNGVQVMEAADADHRTGGSPGVFAWADAHFDNFAGGDLVVLPVSDDFNRADETDISASVNWETSLAGHGNHVPIVSNKVMGENGDAVSQANALWRAATFPDDQYAQMSGLAVPSGQWIGPSVRASGAGGDTGYVVIAFNNSGTRVLQLYQKISSSFTQLGSTYTVPGNVFNLSDVLRIEAEGTTIRVLFNGSEVISATDSGIASGNAGLQVFGDAVSADNWEGGSLAASIIFGSSTLSLTDSIATVGKVKKYGTTTLGLVDSLATVGKVKKYGSSTLTETVSISTDSQGQHRGSSTLVETVAMGTIGKRTARASSSLTLTARVTTSILQHDALPGTLSGSIARPYSGMIDRPDVGAITPREHA
jgi:hypothetical protein